MKTYFRCLSHRLDLLLFLSVCALAIVFNVRAALAIESLAFSFETIQGPGPDGFERNPSAGGTYTQDTIGATHGTKSLKAELIANGDTFVGVFTQLLNPTPHGAIIGDPPGVDHVTFDVTILEQFAGTFANLGITVFGCDQAGNCGLQRQFFDEENVDLPPGTYTNLRINLTEAFGTGESFNQAFGVAGSGSPLIPTHFQFYINKQFGQPFTMYLDNVRVGMDTPGVPGDYNGKSVVDAADYVAWRSGGPLQNEVADPDVISSADYTEWRNRFGNTSGGGGGLDGAPAPEPSSAVLLLVVGGAACWRSRMNRAVR
jgi:hypothetical protein